MANYPDDFTENTNNVLDQFSQLTDTYNTAVDTIGSVPTSTNKINHLQQKKQQKINRLNPDATLDLYNNMDIYTNEYGITKDSLNSYTPEQLQEMLGSSANDRVYYDDKEIGPYQMRRDAEGEWNKTPFSGITQHVYVAPSKDGNMKLGLAGVGFKERYTPGLAAKEGLTTNKNYGWAPGKKGVDPTKEPYLDIALPYDEASRLEFLTHSNKGQIANRAGGASVADYVRNVKPNVYGKGASEYTTQNAPMWNIDSSNTNLPEQVVTPQAPKFLNDTDAPRPKAIGVVHDNTKYEGEPLLGQFADGVARNARGFAGGVARVIGDTAKLANDLETRAIYESAKRLYDFNEKDANELADRFQFLTKEKLDTIENAIAGEDFVAATVDDVKKMEEHQKKAFKDVTWSDPSSYGKVNLPEAYNMFKTGLSSPEMTFKSLGYMLGNLVGLPEKAAIKMAGKGTLKALEYNAKKDVAKEMLSKAAKTDKLIAAGKITTEDAVKKGMTLLDPTKKAMYEKTIQLSDRALSKIPIKNKFNAFVAKNANILHLGAVTNEQDMDDYYEKHGERASLQHALLGFAANAIGAKIDLWADKTALMGTKEGFSALIKKAGKTRAQKMLTGVISGAAKMVEGGIAEYPAEYIQSGIQAFNNTYKDGNATEALTKAFHDAAQGAAFGAASGIHMAGPSAGSNVITNTFTETNSDKNHEDENTESINDTPIDVEETHKEFSDEAARFYNGTQSDIDINKATELIDSFSKTLDKESKAIELDETMDQETKDAAFERLNKHKKRVDDFSTHVVDSLTDAVSESLGEIYDPSEISTEIDKKLKGMPETIIEKVKNNLVEKDIKSSIESDLDSINNALSQISIGKVEIIQSGDDFIARPRNSISNGGSDSNPKQMNIGALGDPIVIKVSKNDVKKVSDSNGKEHYELKTKTPTTVIEMAPLGKIEIKMPDKPQEIGSTVEKAVSKKIGEIKMAPLDKIEIKGPSKPQEIDVDTTTNTNNNNENDSTVDENQNQNSTKTNTEPEDKNIVNNIESEIGRTDTHTEGLSARLINKLAKKYGINNVNLQKTLNSAFDKFILRDMKKVSKEANDFQYKLYYDEDGIIPTYTKYRKALENGDIDTATVELNKIKNKGIEQETKLNKYAAKYEELKNILEEVVSTAKAKDIPELIKTLDTVEFRPQYSKRKMKASDVIKDIALPDSVRKELGIEENSKSNTLAIMESMQESVDHIDNILSANKNTRKLDRGFVVTAQDDLKSYEELLSESRTKLKEIEDLPENEKNKITTKLLKQRIVDSIKNYEKGIERVQNLLNKGVASTKRWVSIQKNFDEKNIRKRIREYEEQLKNLDKDTEEYNELSNKISDMKESIKENKLDSKTLERIKNNLGKPIGEEPIGRKYRKRKAYTTQDTVENIKNDTRNIESNLDGELPKEDKNTKFKAEKAKEDLNKSISNLEDTQKEYNKILVESEKEKENKTTEIKENIHELKNLVKDDNLVDRMLNTKKSIAIGKKALNKAKEELSKLKNIQEKTRKSIEKSLDSAAKHFKEVGMTYDEAKNALFKELKRLEHEAEAEGLVNSPVKALQIFTKGMQKETDNKIITLMKHTKALLFRMLKLNKKSELSKEIEELEKYIKKTESHIEKNEIKLNRQLEKLKSSISDKTISDKVIEKLEKIDKLYDKLNTLSAENKKYKKVLQDKILNIIDSIKGTSLVKTALSNGLTTTKDSWNGNVEGSYEQPLNLNNLIDFTPTILGNLSIKELLENSDIKDSEKIEKELEHAVDILEKSIKIEPGKNHLTLFDSPMSALLFNQNGSINRDIARIIILTAWDWARTDGAKTLFNTDEDIAKIKGYATTYEVTAKDKQVLRHAGSLRRHVAFSIGSNAWNAFGIKAKDGIPEAMIGKMKSNLGLMAIAFLQGSGLIEDINTQHISSTDWNAINDEHKHIKTNESVPTIKGKKSKIETYAHFGEMINNLDAIIDILPKQETYKIRPFSIDDDILSRIKGSKFSAPKQAIETLKSLIKEEYALTDSLDVMEEIYGSGEEGRIKFLESIGWKDLDAMKESTNPVYLEEDIDKQEGVNRGLEAEYDQLIALKKRIDNKEIQNSIFFNWVFTVGGRYNLDSGDINPQSKNLLHRWLVVPTAAQNTKWDKTNDEFMYFKQGLLQGFGIGTDKLSDKTVNKMFDAIKDANISDIINGFKNNNKIKINGIELENEHPGHLFQAIKALKAYQQTSGSTFNATMVSEYDSITSGFANKLMQAPILAKEILYDWLAKVGVFKENDELNRDNMEMGQVIEDGLIIDSYKTLGKGIGEIPLEDSDNKFGLLTPTKIDKKGKEVELNSQSKKAMHSLVNDWNTEVAEDKKLKKEAIPTIIVDGLVTSAARNLFKYPFMIFNYGASILNIKRNTARELAIPIMQGILNDTYAYDSDIIKYLGIHSKNELVQLQKDLKEKSIDAVKVQGDFKSAIQKIEELIIGTYGREIENIMNATFEPLVKLNVNLIEATKIMFASFEKDFKRQVDKLEKEYNRPLSEKETNLIIHNLKDKFPLIRGPQSSSREDGISISNQKLVGEDNKRIVKTGIKIVKKDGKNYANATVNAMKRELQEAHAAGAVLPMHWIDGTIISKQLIKGGALGVHDALVLGNDFENRVYGLNKGMYEVGREYSLVHSIVQSFVETLEATNENDIENINEEDRVSLTLYNLKNIMNNVEETRSELYSHNLIIQNFAGPKGTSFNSKDYKEITLNDIVKNDNFKNNEKFISKLDAIINKILEEC